MNSEVIFYQKANERRIQFSEIGRAGFNARAVLYVNAAFHYAENLGIKEVPIKRITIEDGDDDIQASLFKLE